MTLDKWLTKTPKDRNRLRRRWVGHDLIRWNPLLNEACQRFEREFGKHPFVVRVGGSLSRHEPAIEVLTWLRSPQRIEELPDRYCTFWVVQESLLTKKEERLNYWTLVLQHLLGWPKSRIRSWSSKYEDHLNGQSEQPDIFYHYAPASYVVRALMPKRFVKEFAGTTKYWRLRNQLWAALEPPERGNRVPAKPTDSIYDWTAARNRVRKVLSKYASRS